MVNYSGVDHRVMLDLGPTGFTGALPRFFAATRSASGLAGTFI